MKFVSLIVQKIYIFSRKSNLYDFELNKRKYPIVFNSEYAVSVFGFEKYHPFDTQKWPKVFNKLIGFFKYKNFYDFSSICFNLKKNYKVIF